METHPDDIELTDAERAIHEAAAAAAPSHVLDLRIERETMHEPDEHDLSRLGLDEHPGHPEVAGMPDPG